MPIAIQTQTQTPDKQFVFNFGAGANVLHYVVGISYWSFGFGNTDQRIDTLSLSLASNSTGSQVTTNPRAVLKGGSHEMSTGASSLTLTCIAIVQSENSKVTLAGSPGIPNNGRSAPIPLASATPSVASAFLSGFSFEYKSGKHHVQTLHAGAGLSQDGNTGYITSQCSMNDNSNNWAENPTIDGGLCYVDAASTSLLAQSVIDAQSTSPMTLTFGQNLSAAAVMLQDLYVTYGSGHNHDIYHVGGGTPSWSVSGNKVTLASASAFMNDNSKNHQVDSQSHVSMIVFGVPA